MNLTSEPYLSQIGRWPQSGNHILAQFDEKTIVIYQAYNTTIGHFAAREGHLGGEFNFKRTSWIKTSFLWMMYRSGWGTKPSQEVVLAIWIDRRGFETILERAVHSHSAPDLYPTETQWKDDLHKASVVLQWDPDRNPDGSRVSRRAIQLGLRGEILTEYIQKWTIHIEDISNFVTEQSFYANAHAYEKLLIPTQAPYMVSQSLARRLMLSSLP